MKRAASFRDVLLFLTTIFGATALLTVNSSDSDNDHASYRLSDEVVPISYDLWLFTRLGFDDFAYQGHVNITLNVLRPTNVITLHNDGLLIQGANTLLYRGTGLPDRTAIVPIVDQSYDRKRQFYILKCASKLEAGVHTLVLYFEGEVRDDVFGFYRSAYVDDGRTKWMGVTQFSPTYARRAFPCMDEPHLKAIFTLHIGHTENQTTTSNTAVDSIVEYSDNENYHVTTFSPTPKMSTYLVGWAVHDFLPESSAFSDRFTIWTRKSMHRRGTISLYQALPVYTFLSKYLAFENPLSKMDEFAVPDFNFNAMENWGMITFRESAVLREGGVTPTRKILDGFTTMTHEYAHTWFGNLVTPRFWDVAWLKEGFASYFQYFALSKVQPTWRMMDKFVVDMLQPTLVADSDNHTRTMNGLNVTDPSSIMATLDFVSYKKGASIIRMISHVIGESAFQRGLQSYVKNMSYGAASPSDLYHHLQAALDESVKPRDDVLVEDVMESWTNKPGFPLVTVTRSYNDQSPIVVSQQPFRRSSSLSQRSSFNWWIPLNFAIQSTADFSRTEASHWLSPERDNSTLADIVKPNDWILVNVQQMGYYRVNYDEKNWRMLIDYLRSDDYRKIHRVNRAALLDDAFNVARAGYLDYSIAFELSKYLTRETDYEPWLAAVNNFKFLNRMLSNAPDVQRAFHEYVARLLQPMYEQLSFNEFLNEDLTIKLCRESILSTSCLMRNAHCLRTSANLFETWMATPSKSVTKDVKSFVYCEGIRAGNDETWHRLFTRWQSIDLHTELELLLQALGCTRNASLINRYLQLSISSEPRVPKQYRLFIVDAVLDGHTRNVDNVLEFVEDNLHVIIDRRGRDFLGKMITAIGNAITTTEQALKLRSFVDQHTAELGSSLKSGQRAVLKAFETVEWIKNFLPHIAKFFS